MMLRRSWPRISGQCFCILYFISPLLWHIRSICFCWLRLIHTFMYGYLYSSAVLFVLWIDCSTVNTVCYTQAFVRCKKKNLSHGSRCQQVTGSFYSETFMLLLLFVWSARLYEMCSRIFVCRLCGKWLFPANWKRQEFLLIGWTVLSFLVSC